MVLGWIRDQKKLHQITTCFLQIMIHATKGWGFYGHVPYGISWRIFDYGPLILPCEESVRALLSAQANMDAKSKSGRSPLWIACSEGHLEIARQLVEANANVTGRY